MRSSRPSAAHRATAGSTLGLGCRSIRAHVHADPFYMSRGLWRERVSTAGSANQRAKAPRRSSFIHHIGPSPQTSSSRMWRIGRLWCGLELTRRCGYVGVKILAPLSTGPRAFGSGGSERINCAIALPASSFYSAHRQIPGPRAELAQTDVISDCAVTWRDAQRNCSAASITTATVFLDSEHLRMILRTLEAGRIAGTAP